MSKYRGAALIALAVSGCAANVDVAYPAPAGSSETGAVLVRFTEPMRAVSVAIDGVLVAEDKHTERVRVDGVPTGSREVAVVALAGGRSGPIDRTDVVEVTSGEETAILVATPPRSLGYWIYSTVAIVAYGVLLLVSDTY